MEHLTQKHIYKGQVYTKGSKLLTVLEDTNVWKIVSGKITHDQLWKFINFHEVVVSGRYIISDCCDGFRESDFMTLTYPIYIHDNFGKIQLLPIGTRVYIVTTKDPQFANYLSRLNDVLFSIDGRLHYYSSINNGFHLCISPFKNNYVKLYGYTLTNLDNSKFCIVNPQTQQLLSGLPDIPKELSDMIIKYSTHT